MSSSLVSSTFALVKRLLVEPQYFWILAVLVILGDAILTQLIVRFVPYTEIDWETYMDHIGLYTKGERNYSKITGPTGLLVYPAGHVFIHKALYDLTSSGENIARAQQIYAVLYVVSLFLACSIYQKAGGVPNWVLLLLPLSKRLHSIFALRMFGDCWAVVITQLSILAYGSGLDDLGTTLFSAALSVKMSVFLYLPGILVILVKRRGIMTTVRLVLTMVALQALLARRFLAEYPREYLQGAFDLSRVFLYKWTVNWRFIDEHTFLSPAFARALLLGHVSVLVAFGWYRWTKKDGGVHFVLRHALLKPSEPASLVTLSSDEAITILFTSNLIGILFARSLHYQFYSWYAYQLPFVAWRTPYPMPVKLAVLASIEYAWNVYPSTTLSSSCLLLSNAALVAGLWFGDSQGRPLEPRTRNE
ncbi:mannosyltransferase [Vararia minispora EC-137]|uniref:Mannosyltransferase n=1 Tax=Vararia minispora EC-137 TaxID=1314806 RepID=A0ACB8QKR8_9AGAM|nr:mannosyltransferase [Vararia minispora EC-137]